MFFKKRYSVIRWMDNAHLKAEFSLTIGVQSIKPFKSSFFGIRNSTCAFNHVFNPMEVWGDIVAMQGYRLHSPEKEQVMFMVTEDDLCPLAPGDLLTLWLCKEGYCVKFEKTLQDNIQDSKSDQETVLDTVRIDGWALLFAGKQMQADKEILLAAVQTRGLILSFASDALKNDKDVVLAAVRQDGRALKQASKRLKSDKEVVLAAVKQNSAALKCAGWGLRRDKDLLQLASESHSQKGQ